MTRYHSHSR
ncbi:hypothetical protein BsWGS_18334 [Bradybaena similaris]